MARIVQDYTCPAGEWRSNGRSQRARRQSRHRPAIWTRAIQKSFLNWRRKIKFDGCLAAVLARTLLCGCVSIQIRSKPKRIL